MSAIRLRTTRSPRKGSKIATGIAQASQFMFSGVGRSISVAPRTSWTVADPSVKSRAAPSTSDFHDQRAQHQHRGSDREQGDDHEPD